MKRYESAEPRYTSLKKCQMNNYLATLISCAALQQAVELMEKVRRPLLLVAEAAVLDGPFLRAHRQQAGQV